MARTTGSHADQTARRIASAALRLFARHGYAAVSMRQIASEVGVQAGALYNYTRDKQSLLFGLMRNHMEELAAAVAEAVPPDGDPAARLDRFVAFHLRFHLPRREAVFVSYMELRNLEPENFAVIEAMRRDYEAVLEAILEEGTASGLFEVADSRIATMAIIGMLTEATTWYRPEGRLSIDEVVEIYLDMVRRLVGAGMTGKDRAVSTAGSGADHPVAETRRRR